MMTLFEVYGDYGYVTEDLLRMFGMSARDAHKVCTRPLPDVDL